MSARIPAIHPFCLNDVIPILDDELAIPPSPRRFAAMLDGLALRPETGHRLIVVFPYQMPLTVAGLDEVTLAIHGHLRTPAAEQMPTAWIGSETVSHGATR
jgi:hypothetical protein